MKIVFIRHGQSTANVGLQPEGKDDPQIELTEVGHKQAYECGFKLKDDFEREVYLYPIYTSPYIRARQTFEGIRKGMKDKTEGLINLRSYVDFRIREIYLNDEHKTHSEIREFFKNKYSGNVNRFDFMHLTVPGGEACSRLMDRTHSFLDYISSKYREEEGDEESGVIVVGHSISYAAMRAISDARHFTDICVYERFMYWATEGRIKNCEIVKFDY